MPAKSRAGCPPPPFSPKQNEGWRRALAKRRHSFRIFTGAARREEHAIMSTAFKIPDDALETLIHKYARDLTALTREGRFDPITGREKEIQDTVLILLQRTRKNAIVLAPAGVGKTALIVGLAQKIVSGDVPEYLRDARVLDIDLASMAAGTATVADFHGRFIPLCKGIAERYDDESRPKIIMFIDEIHTIMPTVEGSAYRGLSEVLKPYMTAGDLHVIGATTEDEYRLFVKADPAMDRRFQQVPLKIPNKEETLAILKALRPRYEEHHKTKIPDECLDEIVRMTEEHMRHRNQPDKSIMMMDGACAFHVMQNGWGGTLEPGDIRQIISIEARLHPDAL